jgi:hypothetical protein
MPPELGARVLWRSSVTRPVPDRVACTHCKQSCGGRLVPRVRIHPSPPPSLRLFGFSGESIEIGAWGAIHASPWTRRMPSAAAERKNRAKFSVRDFGGSICEPPNILREPSTHLARTPNASNSACVSLSNLQSLLLRAPERGSSSSAPWVCSSARLERATPLKAGVS